MWQAFVPLLMLGLCLLPHFFLPQQHHHSGLCVSLGVAHTPYSFPDRNYHCHHSNVGITKIVMDVPVLPPPGTLSVGGSRTGWVRSPSTTGSTENLSGQFSRLSHSSIQRSAIPTPSSHRPQDSPASPVTPTNFRSNSAIDLQAARRAQARSQYAQAQRLKVGSGASLRK